MKAAIYILENIEKIYSNVKILLTLIVVRPISSVDDERYFINMYIVNNWLRNLMGQKRLTSLNICR